MSPRGQRATKGRQWEAIYHDKMAVSRVAAKGNSRLNTVMSFTFVLMAGWRGRPRWIVDVPGSLCFFSSERGPLNIKRASSLTIPGPTNVDAMPHADVSKLRLMWRVGNQDGCGCSHILYRNFGTYPKAIPSYTQR